MYPEPQEDVLDEQLVRSVGMAERRKHSSPQTGNRSVIDSHGLVVQIFNSPRVRVVGDRVQRAARQIKKQNVVGLVETSYGIAFQVMDTSLTSTHIGHGYEPSLLPIFSIGKITKSKSDQKSIFALEGAVQFLRRGIASRLRNGHVSRAQYSRKDYRHLF